MSKKVVVRTLYELSVRGKPSLNYFHAWKYLVEVRPYKPNEKEFGLPNSKSLLY